MPVVGGFLYSAGPAWSYGIAAGLGLYFLGVPYPLVWATLGAG